MSPFVAMIEGWASSDATAIEFGERSIGYRALRDSALRIAAVFVAEGLEPGDVIAVQLPRDPRVVEVLLACLLGGYAFVPLNDRATAAELTHVLTDAHARLVIIPDGHAHVASGARAIEATTLTDRMASCEPIALVHPSGDAVGAILYTSGTTGKPKGAVITHANLAATVAALHTAWRWTEDDVLLHALPLFHIHGLFVAQLGALWAGARSVWMPRFDALDALRALERVGATVFMGVPTFYQRFIELPATLTFDLSRVRLFTCGSAPLAAHVLTAFQHRFGHRVLERYGMTEVGIVLSNPYDGERRAGAVGLPLAGVEARICDAATDAVLADGAIGELRIRGPSVFREYLDNPEKTAATFDSDGYVRTGDLAVREGDGYFKIVGRLRDLVIAGGLNIYPTEVEAVIVESPEVDEVAVIGVIDADLGERLVADVVFKPGTTADTRELDAFVRRRLAPYKCPRAWRVVASLPRNAMGKVAKAAIRAAWEVPVVRPGHPDDVGAIARGNMAMALETEGYRLDPSAALEGARAVFDHNAGAQYFVVDVAGQYAGQCMITTEWSDWRARHVWWLQSVWIHPAYRRRGVFRALYAAVIAQARTAGAAGVRLYVDHRNTDAAAVYRRLGMNGDHYAMFEQMFHEPPAAREIG